MRRKFRRRANSQAIAHRCEPLENRRLFSGVGLVKDINTGTSSSYAAPLGVAGAELYFIAGDNSAFGERLYKTDGTAAGTVLVLDRYPNTISFPNDATGVDLNGRLIFPSHFDQGNDLSITDGIAAGTTVLKTLSSNIGVVDQSNSAHNLTVVDDKVFFQAPYLWVTDGTPAGTLSISQLAGDPSLDAPTAFTQLGNDIYFLVNGQLWETDGSAAGTTKLLDNISRYSTSLTAFDGRLYFYQPSETTGLNTLWETDGTASGTTMVSDLAVGNQAPFGAGSNLVFFTRDSIAYPNASLIAYNPVTHATTDLLDGLDPNSFSPPALQGFLPDGRALFTADTYEESGLWVTDGTVDGTKFITYEEPSGNTLGQHPNSLGILGNSSFFAARPSGQAELDLFATDGSSLGTRDVAVSQTYSTLAPQNFMTFRGRLYFTADDLQHGFELWSTDGTTAGTGIFLDLNTANADSSPLQFSTDGSKVYFSAVDNNLGGQTWLSDGSSSGTRPLGPGGSPADPVAVAGKTFYHGGFSSVFYETDGTATGTINFSVPGVGFDVLNYAAANSTLLIAATDSTHGEELYRTDGTAAGTALVADLASGPNSSDPSHFMSYNGKVLFTAIGTGGVNALYTSDGTTVGTVPILSLPSAGVRGNSVILNGQLYFILLSSSASNRGLQLWRTDGTGAGTSFVAQLTSSNPTTSPNVSMVATATTLYFVIGSTVGRSAGTAAGTFKGTLVTNLTTPIVNLTAGTSQAFFESSTNLPGHTSETLFSTDGTAAGTQVLNDLNIRDTAHLSVVDGIAYVVGNTAVGSALWKSDGTVGGTSIMVNLSDQSGYIQSVFAFKHTLYLNASDGIHGAELMTINLQDSYTGSGAADVVTLVRDVDNTHVDWSSGSITGQLPVDAPNGLTLNSAGSNDVIKLDYSHGNPFPNTLHLNGTFTINGLIGANPLAGTMLDINASTLFITYGDAASDPMQQIRNNLTAGYNNGTWSGVATASAGAIDSTSAAANPLLSSVGYADSRDQGNPAKLPANTVELRYTAIGDTNLDGTVGLVDLTTLLQNYNTGTRWDQGNINYDNSVGLTDLTTLLQHYNQSVTPPSATLAAYPIAVLATSPAVSPAAPPAMPVASASKKSKKLMPTVTTPVNTSRKQGKTGKRSK